MQRFFWNNQTYPSGKEPVETVWKVIGRTFRLSQSGGPDLFNLLVGFPLTQRATLAACGCPWLAAMHIYTLEVASSSCFFPSSLAQSLLAVVLPASLSIGSLELIGCGSTVLFLARWMS